jgi:hypothetical protein
MYGANFEVTFILAASVVGEEIRKLILKLYSAFLTDGGKVI